MNDEDELWMRRALSLAELGRGHVEPNPLVGCVLVRDGRLIGEGYHRRWGQAHAEVEALQAATAAGHDPSSATAYVTLEPCSHFGKTPPCSQALLKAGIARVVAALQDPAPHVAGRGLQQLREAGITVRLGVLEAEARRLLAPYLKRLRSGLPWVIAKWAMTLDGKIASRRGHSQWISGPEARAKVHQWRGEMDAILVGIGTALADDPLLTARPAGPRVARRVVLDRQLRLPLESQLLRTAGDAPLLVATAAQSDADKQRELQQAGAQVWCYPGPSGEHFDYQPFVRQCLEELARQGATNVLVEGGAALLGNLFSQGLVDEVRIFVAPCVVGGHQALSPVGGEGWDEIGQGPRLQQVSHQVLGRDILIQGHLDHGPSDATASDSKPSDPTTSAPPPSD